MSGTPSIRIGARWEPGDLGSYDVVNPANEELVAPAPEASVAQAEAAAAAAREAQPEWAARDAADRARLLERVASLIEARADTLLPLIISETGCTETVGRQMQIPVAVERFRTYARLALDPVETPLPPHETQATPLAPGGLIGAIARRQPVGVVACITPYNFPVVSAAGKLGPALAMGNTVVLRPAPQDPLAVIALARLFDEAGFPSGVVNIVTGSTPATGEALVASPAVDMVSFTGSSAVGRRIGEVAGSRMKRLLLELGGKGAALVLDDADLDNAARMIGSVWSFHSGQICTAPTRTIVHRSQLDALIERLCAYGGALPVGDPYDAKTVVGPVISAAQRERIEGFATRARDGGAQIPLGGERPDSPARGYYAAPTLVVCRPEDEIAQEEIFGPVIAVMPFDEDEEAISIANGTSYGLYDYVFSADTQRAMRMSRRLQAGNVGINTTQRNPHTPFGGTKQSGVGRDGGGYGLHAYSELQSVVWPG